MVLIAASQLLANDFPAIVKINAKELVSLSPKSVYTFTVFLQSLSDKEIAVDEIVEVPKGWSCIFPPERFRLKQGESTVRLVSVHIPANALSGLYTIKYSLEIGHATVTKDVHIEILPNLELKVLGSSAPSYLVSHSEFSFYFTVLNAGNTNLKIQLASRLDTFISIEPSQIELSPFETRKIKVTGRTPDDDFLFLDIELLGTSPTGRKTFSHFRSQIEILPEGIQRQSFPPDSVLKFGYSQSLGLSISLNSENHVKASSSERYCFNLNIDESKLDGFLTFEEPGFKFTLGNQSIQNFKVAHKYWGTSLLQTKGNSFLESGVFMEPVNNTLLLKLRLGTALESFYFLNGNVLFSSENTCFAFEHSIKFSHLILKQSWESSFAGSSANRELFSFSGVLSYPDLNFSSELSLQNFEKEKSYNISSLLNYRPELDTTFSFKYGLYSNPSEEKFQTWTATLEQVTPEKLLDLSLSFEKESRNGLVRKGFMINASGTYYLGKNSLSVSFSINGSSHPDDSTTSNIETLLQLSTPIGDFKIGGALYEEKMDITQSQKHSLLFSYSSSLSDMIKLSTTLECNFENSGFSASADFLVKYSSPKGESFEFSLQNISNYQDSSRYHFSILIPFTSPFIYAERAGEISGRVFTHDGTPLADVVVSLNGRKVLTDSKGYYSFRNLPSGKYYVDILRESLPKPLIPLHYPSQIIELKTGERRSIDFTVAPAAQLKGMVVLYRYQKTLFADEKLVPAEILNRLTVILTNTSGEIRYATTDEKGNFMFPELEPGHWTLILDEREIPVGFTVKTNYISIDIQPGEVVVENIDITPKAKPIIYVGETKSL